VTPVHRAQTEALDAHRAEMRRYFDQTAAWNDKFWSRLGGRPEMRGRRCLDMGCGIGSLAIDAALAGAHVVGVDPDETRIAYARETVVSDYPAIADRIEFRAARAEDLDDADDSFDIVMARDTFEHIHDLPSALAAAHRALRPGGRLYAGFGPLYRSPFGDHRLLRLWVPWAHLVLFSGIPNGRAYRRRRREVDLVRRELNFMTLAELEAVFAASEFEVEKIQVNVSSHPAMRVFSALRRIPLLHDYFTVNVYVTLAKAGAS
jgi:SAM-dependent methyltransferase